MWFRILGTTEVRLADGTPLSVGGPRVRSLLALLLLDPGQVVTTERLIDGLYGENPPAGAANALQSQVSRLRRGLRGEPGGGEPVEFHPAGYRLAVDPDDVDAHRFQRLAGEGRRALAAGEHARAAALLREGLDLWRGPALADVADAPFADAQTARLEELRASATEDLAEAELVLGRHRDLVPELHGLVDRHPLRERAQAQLMRALYGSGRQAEALAVYEDARRLLAEELGTDPSPELSAVHLAILQADPSLLPPSPAHPTPGPGHAAPGPTQRQPGPGHTAPGPAHAAFHPTQIPPGSMQTQPGSGYAASGPGYADVASGPQAQFGSGDAASGLAYASPGFAHVAAGLDHASGGPAYPPSGPVSAHTGEAVPRVTPSRLPAPLTTFVGREEELRRVGELLRGQRLLTLIGPGGAGKTRLAVEAGALETGEVCFVDLAPLGGGSEVPGALLGALGLRESGLMTAPGEGLADPAERLVTALAGRRMLLILDNCEHVIDEAARLVHRLLAACPGLRVLATSREALGITGESLWPLPPLALPPEDVPAERALEYPAVRLLADRAAAVRPGFAVDAGNVDLVLRICRDLDGLPLAIELAAARLRSLPPDEVAARLDDRFRLLSRGDRTAAPRHQTLRAVVEWSWDLLDAEEQTLARRLTVFSGGATLEAAAQVCGMPADEVDELLAGLVDKSFVHRGLSPDGRYRMLETIRAFCAERLAEAGERDRLYRAHAEYFFDLARTADPCLRRNEQLDWLARLAAEHGNLHAALRRSIHRDPALALRLVAALSWYWWLRGRVEGAPLARELLAAVGDGPPGDLGEEWVLCVANAASGNALGPELNGYLDRAEAILKGIDRPLRWPGGIVYWALLAGPERTSIEQHRVQVGTDAWSQALSHMGDGFQSMLNGEIDLAEPEFTAAHEGFRAIGDRWGMANSLDSLAQIARWRGDRERFRALIDQALELVDRLGAHEERADLLALRAGAFVQDGDYARAEADYELAAEVARRAGAGEKADGMYHGLGEIARLRGDLAAARRYYEASLNAASDNWYATSWTRAQALIGLGWTAEAEGDADRARALHRQGLTLAVARQNIMYAADAVDGLAGVALRDGDGERAALLLGIAAGLRGNPEATGADTARVAAEARELLGEDAYRTAYDRGSTLDREEALRLATT